MLTLYAYRFCPFCRRARIVAAEKGVELDYVETLPNEELPAEVRAFVPIDHGVPVLHVYDDFVLFDSFAIMHWLDAAYSGSLMPGAPETNAIAASWIGWAPSALYHPMHALSGDDPDAADEAVEALASTFARIESIVPEDDWLVGGVFTLADVAMAPALAIMPEALLEAMGPRVRAYTNRLKTRPSVRYVCELDAISKSLNERFSRESRLSLM